MEHISPSREEDRKVRLDMLESMRIALKYGYIEQAKSLGESARKIKEKIATYDYSHDDAFLEKITFKS